MRSHNHSHLGKYRDIVAAVAFFLVFDLAVLVLNFYISYQISGDALGINLAGRQRMLSQRMTKALLTVQGDVQAGADPSAALVELRQTVSLFDKTLHGFEHGGMVPGGDGKPVSLAPITATRARAILDEADGLWAPLDQMVQDIPGAGLTTTAIDPAVTYAQQHNLALLDLMNRLTTTMEQTANARANRLRAVQTGGILLALLNFAFILFKFLRRLRQNDRQIEIAQNETAEILGTVKEGLFLLDSDFRIGSQYSASLSDILGRDISPGDDFRLLLKPMVPRAVYTAACDYIGLLFGDRVKETLVTQLNPLTAVEVTMPGMGENSVCRHLTLQFNRVMDRGRISHLLVTVFDVTVQVELERALAAAKERARTELDVMLDLLKVNPAVLSAFLDRAERLLLEVNDRLRSVSGEAADYRHTLAAIFRHVHTLKGEAATLGLGMFEDLAQQFESVLADLRAREHVSGEDFVSLPLPLDEFLKRVGSVRDLVGQLARYHDAFSDNDQNERFGDNLADLAQRIADDHGKAVAVVADLDLLTELPGAVQRELQDIAVQLLRNAVAHGIEESTERTGKAKPPTGHVHVTLKPIESGEYEFSIRDDGRGLVPDDIREALLRSGRYSKTQLDQLDDRQVIMKIFEPGFSTADQVDRHAGQGIGMDVVKQKLQQLGAKLMITTRKDMFTQFSIRFAA